MTDAKEHAIEGGYVFTIIGEGFDGTQFRFNHLELIPDKREYAPGEKVKLQINTDRAGGTVLLFLRPANGVYLPPKVIRLDGKSTVEEIDGRRRRTCPTSSSRRSPSPTARSTPRPRRSSCRRRSGCSTSTSQPSADTYQAGREGQGQGQADRLRRQAVRRLDRAWPSTTSRSSTSPAARNVPEIKEFFWKWRRHHHPQTETSLDRGSPQPRAAGQAAA